MILQIHNPNHLPTIHYTNLRDFQGDLKFPIEPQALTKMRNSLMKHGVFVPKFVWFDEAGNANILDGHQTKQGLVSLEADGWEIPPIPYVTVAAASREDAAEKLVPCDVEIYRRYTDSEPELIPHSNFGERWIDESSPQEKEELIKIAAAQ